MQFREIPEAPFPRHWLLGQTGSFAASTLGFVKGCQETGHPLVRARIAFRDFIVLLHPELVQWVLQKNYRNYRKSFAYKGLKDFLGEGLLTSEGDFWLRQRRTMQGGFHRGSLQQLQTIMEERSQAFAQQLIRESENAKSLQSLFLDLTREITSDCLFGPGLLDRDGAEVLDTSLSVLRKYANDRLKNPFAPPAWVPTKGNLRFRKAVAALRGVVDPLIARRRASEKGDDLLGTLIQLQDPESGLGMSDAQLYDEVATLFVAGQETTTQALVFALYLLDQHPGAVARIRDGDGDYLDAVIRETLRLYPPAWAVSREAIGKDQLNGFEVPAGTTLFLSLYAIHRHPDFWEAPDEFRPERFLDNPRPEAYYPFGHGPRVCIGNHFAMMEMKAVLSAILQQLNWKFSEHQDWSLITPMTLGFRSPVKVNWQVL